MGSCPRCHFKRIFQFAGGRRFIFTRRFGRGNAIQDSLGSEETEEESQNLQCFFINEQTGEPIGPISTLNPDGVESCSELELEFPTFDSPAEAEQWFLQIMSLKMTKSA